MSLWMRFRNWCADISLAWDQARWSDYEDYSIGDMQTADERVLAERRRCTEIAMEAARRSGNYATAKLVCLSVAHKIRSGE